MANEKILVVDDDTNICELLRLYLTKEGYQVTTANDGEEGLEKFNQLKPDMVLLDVMMPRMDGLEVCRRIRKLGNTPVMMLTAKGETFDKVLGLELGADDYVCKPVRPRVLLARIRALLRRSEQQGASLDVSGEPQRRLQFGALQIDQGMRGRWRLPV
jgi:DNA-binding response OmpR family regulator